MLLDFVIIGAEKSGTTLLVKLLQRSDRISIPEREVRYFRDPFFPDRENPDILLVDGDRLIKGIKHPSYLGKPEVPHRLKEHNSSLKLIALLREPTARFISSYLHYARLGQIPLIHPNHGLKSVIQNPEAHPKYRDILQFTTYSAGFARYLKLFPREQICVEEYEEFIRSIDCTKRVFEFLGVQVPDGLWPLPKINEGIYDWAEIAQSHRRARRRFIYDDAENIIGQREVDEGPREPFVPDPIEISDDARSFLRAHFSKEGQILAEMGILAPLHW